MDAILKVKILWGASGQSLENPVSGFREDFFKER